MLTKTISCVAALSIFACAAGTSGLSFEDACVAFDAASLVYNSSVRIHEYLPANTTVALTDNDSSCSRTTQLYSKEVCRIALTIPTSSRSSTIAEFFFPNTDSWNQRYLATGNGGIDGCIKYEDIAYGIENDFMTSGHNNGHNGTGGTAFLNNPDIVTDFSYRSMHTVTNVSKILLVAFYKKAQNKSYYLGCSGGGREGIQSAYLYPNDFDGIIAGSPAINFNYMSSWRASFYPITGTFTDADFILNTTWTGLIHDEVLAQCDEIDGVADGILVDPSLCHFNATKLLCNSNQIANQSVCLTAGQVGVVNKVYSPLFTPNGSLVYPGLQPGAETLSYQKLLAGVPFAYSQDWFRYVVFANASWDPATFTTADAVITDALNPSNVRTWPSTLDTFRSGGGKMLSYHGTQDNQVTGFNTERFYNRLNNTMGLTTDEMDTWYRFFRIPGMNHCNSGPGAWEFGQYGAGSISYDPQYNILAALVQWVEHDIAPNTITGTKYNNDTASDGVAFQREHCRYPYRSTYVGGGANPNETSSWTCKFTDEEWRLPTDAN